MTLKYNEGQTAVFLRDLTGQEYPAIAVLNRKRRVNGQREITLSFLYTDINKDFMDKLEFGWKVLFKNEEYTITNPGIKTDGDYFSVGVTAILSFFVDLNGYYLQDKAEDKSTIATEFFHQIFDGTPFSFVLVDNFAATTLTYQDNQSRTERFLYGIDRYNCEYKVQGKNVYLYSLVGYDKDVILHEDLNINEVSIEIDASGFHTWAKGFGDLPDDDTNGNYQIEVEYRSPLIEKYGAIEGPAIKDGNYKVAANLTNAVKEQVENSYKMSTTINAVDLTNNGYPEMVLEEGDRIWLYVDRLNLNQQVRVMDIDETFDWEGNIIDTNYTIGNEGIATRYKTQQYNTLKDFQDILSGRKPIAYNWLPQEVKRASDIINGNQDSLFKYLPGEIIGINQSNPNGYMRFNTDGLGFSRDGGKTYQTAMTYEGIVADAIFTGTLNAALVRILTGLTNARIEMDGDGFRQYDVNGREVINFDPASEFPTFFGTLVKVIADNALDLNGIQIENPFIGVDSRFVARTDPVLGEVSQIESFQNGVYTNPMPIHFRANYIDMFTSVIAEVNMRRLFIKGGSDALTIEANNGNGYIAFHNGTNRTGEIGNKDTTTNDILVAAITTGAKLVLFAQGGIIAFTESGTNGQHINTVDDNARWKQSVNNHITQFTSGNVEIFKNGLMLFRFNSTTDDTDRRMVAGDSGFKFTRGKTPVEIHAINASDTGHVPVVASSFDAPSLRSLKTGIEKVKRTFSDLVKSTPIYEYWYKKDKKKITKRTGFIYEEAPEEIRGNNTINYNNVSGILWKSQQEILDRLDKLEVENKKLKATIESLK